MEQVVLVNEQNQALGTMEKLQAHQEGKLHRAFSVFIENSKGEWLLQRRALEKYHCGGLWSNAVCSHPRPGESYEEATRRRMQEEMGFVCDLEERFSFVYEAEVGDLIEYEHDTVFWGIYDGEINPNPAEVMDWEWKNVENLWKKMQHSPEEFTPWFRIICERFLSD